MFLVYYYDLVCMIRLLLNLFGYLLLWLCCLVIVVSVLGWLFLLVRGLFVLVGFGGFMVGCFIVACDLGFVCSWFCEFVVG